MNRFARFAMNKKRAAPVVGPALIYNFDFENDFTGNAGIDSASSTIVTTPTLGGTKAARVVGGTAGWGFQYNLPSNTEFYHKTRVRLDVGTNPPTTNASVEMLKFGNGTNWRFILSHVMRTDGTSGISVWNAPAAQQLSSTGTNVPRGTPFELDVYLKIAATGGRIVVRVNGTIIHDFTGNTGTLAIDRVNYLGQASNVQGAAFTHYFDDIQGATTGYPIYGSTPPVTPPPGPATIVAAGPNSNIATAGLLGFATPDTDFSWYNGVTDKAVRQKNKGSFMSRSDLRSNEGLSHYDPLINAITANSQWMIGLIMGGTNVGGANIERLDTAARRQAYIDWAVSCVQRWGTNGGTGQIKHWQILNELNLNAKASPENYALLMPPLYDAMKAADPNCFIITNGLSSVVDTAGDDMSTLDWTNRFMTALPTNRRDNCFDAWAQQPYTASTTPDTAGAWQAWNQVDRNYNIMVNDYGVKKQVWLTEYGDPTNPPGAYAVVSEAFAKANLEMAYYRACRTPWLGPVLIYSERDRPVNNGISADSSSETFFGISLRDGTDKEAAERFRTFTARDRAGQISRPASGQTRQFWLGRYFSTNDDNFDLTGVTFSITALAGLSVDTNTGMATITSNTTPGTFTVTATLGSTSAQMALQIV